MSLVGIIEQSRNIWMIKLNRLTFPGCEINSALPNWVCSLIGQVKKPIEAIATDQKFNHIENKQKIISIDNDIKDNLLRWS